jgi:hypothetical protein
MNPPHNLDFNHNLNRPRSRPRIFKIRRTFVYFAYFVVKNRRPIPVPFLNLNLNRNPNRGRPWNVRVNSRPFVVAANFIRLNPTKSDPRAVTVFMKML